MLSRFATALWPCVCSNSIASPQASGVLWVGRERWPIAHVAPSPGHGLVFKAPGPSCLGEGGRGGGSGALRAAAVVPNNGRHDVCSSANHCLRDRLFVGRPRMVARAASRLHATLGSASTVAPLLAAARSATAPCARLVLELRLLACHIAQCVHRMCTATPPPRRIPLGLGLGREVAKTCLHKVRAHTPVFVSASPGLAVHRLLGRCRASYPQGGIGLCAACPAYHCLLERVAAQT